MWESRRRFPSLASARRHLQASQAASRLIKAGGRYCSSFASTAQAIRASLLAKATATTLWWVRPASCASQALMPGACFVRCCKTARAPCMNSLRRLGRELPPLAESRSVADGSDQRSRGNRTDAGYRHKPLAGFILMSRLVEYGICRVDSYRHLIEFQL